MASTYTAILKLELPTTGELSGSWGNTVNNSITTLIEAAIAGASTINTWGQGSDAANTHTLTTANGAAAEARSAVLKLTDTGTQLTSAGTVIVPALSKIYVVTNSTGQSITVKTASGTGILIRTGFNAFMYCDGTNVVDPNTRIDLDVVLANASNVSSKTIELDGNSRIDFADNAKARFGASDDLEIFHDGSNSFVKDVGTGDLRLQGANVVAIQHTDGTEYVAATTAGTNAGQVQLNYNGSTRVKTVGGGSTLFGQLEVDGISSGSPSIRFNPSTDADSVTITQGTTTPEGNKTAVVGSLHMVTDTTYGGLWVKMTGTGNTGWEKVSTS